MLVTDKQAVKRFVQEELGCTCPDEVFSNIEIEDSPASFADLSEGQLILIGGKLIVYLIQTNDGMNLTNKLEQIFNRAREIRNKNGFNRFRLVVSAPSEQLNRDILTQQFENLVNIDERLHLHVIKHDQFPLFVDD
jgi:hypothetical protein